MFFSILIPVYNTSEYLPECMDSVLSQSFRDFEVVLLDDGSTDNSGQLCDKYAQKDERVRVIHKQNEGLMMTRRRGFKEAKGDYFICVDSDDKLYDPKALERVYQIITETDCDLVLYNYVYGAGAAREERERKLFDLPSGHIFEKESKKDVYTTLLTTNYMNNIWLRCPSKSIVDIDVDYHQWKDAIVRAEDLFQSYPVFDNAKRIGYLRYPLYYYRWAPDSISNKYKYSYYDAFKCIFNREDEYLLRWDLPSDVVEEANRRRITRISDVICTCYFNSRNNNTLSAWKEFIIRISSDPFYIDIIDQCDKTKVLLYYRILHFLIIHKRIALLTRVIRFVSFLSRTKKRLTK